MNLLFFHFPNSSVGKLSACARTTIIRVPACVLESSSTILIVRYFDTESSWVFLRKQSKITVNSVNRVSAVCNTLLVPKEHRGISGAPRPRAVQFNFLACTGSVLLTRVLRYQNEGNHETKNTGRPQCKPKASRRNAKAVEAFAKHHDQAPDGSTNQVQL